MKNINAKIQIKSKLGSTTEDELYDLYTLGSYTEKNGSYYINYTENTASDEQANTIIKVSTDRLVIMRCSGNDDANANETHLVIEKNKRSEGLYKTPMGNLLVGVNNACLDSTLDKDGGRVSFSYDIDMNGHLMTKNEMTINVTANA